MRISHPLALYLRVIDEKDTKLKTDELMQKRMIFYPSGFNFNDRSILWVVDDTV